MKKIGKNRGMKESRNERTREEEKKGRGKGRNKRWTWQRDREKKTKQRQISASYTREDFWKKKKKKEDLIKEIGRNREMEKSRSEWTKEEKRENAIMTLQGVREERKKGKRKRKKQGEGKKGDGKERNLQSWEYTYTHPLHSKIKTKNFSIKEVLRCRKEKKNK